MGRLLEVAKYGNEPIALHNLRNRIYGDHLGPTCDSGHYGGSWDISASIRRIDPEGDISLELLKQVMARDKPKDLTDVL